MGLTVIVLIFQVILSPCYCQAIRSEKINGSLFPADTLAIGMYKRIMNHSYDVVNGRDYIVYHNIYKSNPFFKSATISTGTIFYNGRIFSDLNLLYDIYKDELILNYLNSDGYLKLISINKNCLDSFRIIIDNEPVMFQTIIFPESSELKSGFYEIAYRGRTQLLIKHVKELEKKDGYDNYIYDEHRYLNIYGTNYRIRSLSKFIKLFGDKSTLIKKYIGSMHVISFRRITDAELVRILRYYETL
jgi:hypothetical protein